MMSVRCERDVPVPMRDGVRLAADVWRPSGDRPVPVLVSRTPYDKAVAAATAAPEELARAGFAVVIQDCRGRFGSEGEWTYVHAEVDDGYDTVEWAAAQPWSNGRVGMFGASYMGYTQWLAAVARPPHLEVIAPECCAADYWVASYDAGGTFRLALRLGWTALVVAGMATRWGIDDPQLAELEEVFEASREAVASGDPVAVREARERSKDLLQSVFRARPLRGNPLWHGRATWLDEIFDHEERDDPNWVEINPSTHYASLDLPAVHVGGWYDIHLQGTLDNFTGMRRRAATEQARTSQRLVVGPWPHWTPTIPVVGDVDFGPEAVLDLTELRLAWFRRWLQEPGDRVGGRVAPGPADTAPVRLFVMGENVWRDEQEWPLARTVYTPWYLRAGGNLGPVPPEGDEGPDRYTHDPADPVPTVGGRLLGSGQLAGPFDQRRIGQRRDVLAFTSEPLDAPLELTGPVQVELWAATDAPDTDFTATLIDVHPDGTALNLCEGAVRARHCGVPLPLVPGAAYRFTIDLVATSVLVGAGHQLRLHVASSSFPQWEPNPNTGHPLGVDGHEDLRVAHQTVFHDTRRPSRVVLPVIPR